MIVLAATNRPEVLDQALLRPGRFDRRIAGQAPDKPGRLEILRIHTREVPLAGDVDLDQIAASTPGATGAAPPITSPDTPSSARSPPVPTPSARSRSSRAASARRHALHPHTYPTRRRW